MTSTGTDGPSRIRAEFPECGAGHMPGTLVPRASPVGSVVKNPPVNAGARVRFLGREAPLEKEMAVHSSILARRIPWTEEPGGL